ncbi:MAG TPA: SDR family NAD(P)-dependent oxidoreductase [Parvularculaceae bacterium]|nr:SDR family NAD(P)-dependent oxidoreductase [Parvularculaceae bacterium]
MKQTIPDLSGKTALVTGASRGLGRAMALALAKAGAHVLALARTVGGLEELDDEIQAAGAGSASLIPLDLADPAAIERLGPALAARFPKLDIFVANAGVLGELAPLPDIDDDIWRRTIDLNLTANWRLIKTLDPLLRASGAARAVFITSKVGGAEARPFWGAYACSKAALEILAETYALESKLFGIKVAIIDPGAMRTRMREKAMPGEDPKTLPDPSELAPLLYAAVSPDYAGLAERFIFREWRAKALS